MVNEIDFKDPRYVMNCIVCLSKELAALKDEVASLRIAQQPQECNAGTFANSLHPKSLCDFLFTKIRESHI